MCPKVSKCPNMFYYVVYLNATFYVVLHVLHWCFCIYVPLDQKSQNSTKKGLKERKRTKKKVLKKLMKLKKVLNKVNSLKKVINLKKKNSKKEKLNMHFTQKTTKISSLKSTE